jgi:hypothetical protein
MSRYLPTRGLKPFGPESCSMTSNIGPVLPLLVDVYMIVHGSYVEDVATAKPKPKAHCRKSRKLKPIVVRQSFSARPTAHRPTERLFPFG